MRRVGLQRAAEFGLGLPVLVVLVAVVDHDGRLVLLLERGESVLLLLLLELALLLDPIVARELVNLLLDLVVTDH